MLNTLVAMGSESTVTRRNRPSLQDVEEALPSRSTPSGGTETGHGYLQTSLLMDEQEQAEGGEQGGARD